MRVGVLVVLGLVLAGCGQRHDMPAKESSDALVSLDAPMVAARAGPRPGSSPGESASPGAPVSAPPTAPMIAYVYTDEIWAPAAQVKPLMQLHQKACVDAGPVACQVVSIQQSQGDQARAVLEVRATPAWIARLHQRLDGDAKAAGGRLTESEVSSEDLTRSIVDGEAYLRAQTTLRDRLQKLLAERPGKLAELLEVERELARVQGQVDAAQSNLAVMRTRVTTSSLTLSYQSLQPTSRPSGAWGPLVEALREIQSTLAVSLGVLVQIAAFALPWIVVIGLALWLLRKRLPRLRRKAAESETPPPG
jgi:hypothetical protein